MNIAIMGAGISGLACAITLEQQGIFPTIFENRTKVGDRFVNGEACLPSLERPILDNYAYLSETYRIFLQPLSNIKKIHLFSENSSASLSGHLGFTNLRGNDENSCENQLARQVKSKIIFNSTYTYEQLLKEFTHIVIATGDAAYTAKLQNLQEDLTVTIKGATVKGNFDPHTVAVWLDYTLAPQGYCYLIPTSDKLASITIAYPDYPENKHYDINQLWDNFYHRVCSDYNQNLEVVDTFEISRYIFGHALYPRIGNTFFTGNCFGAMMPAFGFGQFSSILTGIFAAYDLAGLGNYAELTKTLRKGYDNALVLRRSLEKINNSRLDSIVRIAGTTSANRLLINPHINLMKLTSYLLRPYAAFYTRRVRNH